MKGQLAIALATVRQAVREGKKPPRDTVLAFFSDEEAGGTLGAQYVVKNRPDLFEGCSEVLGLEVGGFSFSLPNGKRVYLVQTGERGMGWGEFTTKGTQGHGSQVNHDNPLVKMVGALHRLTSEDSSLQAPLTDTMRQTLGMLAGGLGMEFDESDPMAVIRELGPIAKWLENSVQSGFNLTQVHGGEKDNVVPGSTKSTVDVRPLPGQEQEFKATVERLLGDDVEKNWKVFLNGWENPLPTDAERAMSEAIRDQDPEALVVGWVMPAGTDAKAFKKNFPELPTYGFCPLQLPADLDFAGLFHAPEERVPLETLRWGTRAFGSYLSRCGVSPDAGGFDAPRVTRNPDGSWSAAPRESVDRDSDPPRGGASRSTAPGRPQVGFTPGPSGVRGMRSAATRRR
jgi:acetylornithine deacetylase/succinyl-diaminopimelate desuccinylase-like protein